MQCIILTGDIKTGKTTSLFKLLPKLPGVTGVLQPVVDDRRYIYCISTRRLLAFETDNEQADDAVQVIGKYRFLQNAFDEANKYLQEQRPLATMIVVDEVGPLELAGKGLHEAVASLCQSVCTEMRVVFVVRSKLVTDFTERYLTPHGIVPSVVTNPDELLELLQRE